MINYSMIKYEQEGPIRQETETELGYTVTKIIAFMVWYIEEYVICMIAQVEH